MEGAAAGPPAGALAGGVGARGEAHAGGLGGTGAAARPGRLVTLEGIDGSGKSTLARDLHQALRDRGHDAVLTREPTDSWLGQAVHRALREHGDPFAEAFLFLADHADHVRRVEAWLEAGQVVVSDRYGESCLAYQAATLGPLLAARGVRALDWLAQAQAPVHRAPDVCLLLDLPAEAAAARLAARGALAKFERAAFLAEVRGNYLELARRRGYFVVLDAGQAPGDLLRAALAALRARGIWP